MNRILAIETTTKVCSVAVFEDGKCLYSEESDDHEYDHAEKLNPFIQALIAKAGWEISSLSAIAVSMGPGSYTGLRIGVSSAKGLCYALNIPLLAINPMAAMLEMLADKQSLSEDFQYYAMLDARRREVFCQAFNAKRGELNPVQAKIFEADDDFFKREDVVCFGPGAEKFGAEVQASLIKGVYPSAKYMGYLAYSKFEKNDICDLAYFEPYYLKDFIAIKAKPKFNRRNT